MLPGVDLAIAPGERVLLIGPSGAGKSTLLRAAAGVLGEAEAGDLDGTVTLDGAPVVAGDGRVGLLLQDPLHARVAPTAWRDVAFGPENLGLPRTEIHDRVAEALDRVGFPYGPHHPTTELSGGEAQRLALAGVLAMRPQVLLLDEPTAMLDEENGRVVVDAVRAALTPAPGQSHQPALVVAEHRLGLWAELVERIVVLGADGAVLLDGPTHQILTEHHRTLLDLGIWVPGATAPRPHPIPVDLLDVGCATPTSAALVGPVVSARGVGVRYTPRRFFGLATARPSSPRDALSGVDLDIAGGSWTVLRGPSGAGKSTLLELLVGLRGPTSGAVTARGVITDLTAPDPGPEQPPHRWRSRELASAFGWAPQQASATIAGRTVADSALATVRALGRDEPTSVARLDQLLEALGLDGLQQREPHTLSGGELRRLAVLCAVLHGPALVAADEPTAGLDRHAWAAVAGLLSAARAAGIAVVTSTHDDALAALGDRTLHLVAGRVAATGEGGG